MIHRTAILSIVASLALSSFLTHAKVSPVMELQRHDADSALQKVIDETVERQWCGPGNHRGNDGEQSINLPSLVINGYAKPACPLPAPSPDALENVAYVL